MPSLLCVTANHGKLIKFQVHDRWWKVLVCIHFPEVHILNPCHMFYLARKINTNIINYLILSKAV